VSTSQKKAKQILAQARKTSANKHQQVSLNSNFGLNQGAAQRLTSGGQHATSQQLLLQ